MFTCFTKLNPHLLFWIGLIDLLWYDICMYVLEPCFFLFLSLFVVVYFSSLLFLFICFLFTLFSLLP